MWNGEVYGNIFHKKKVLLKKVQGIENNLYQDHKGYLAKLQNDLWIAYQDILTQEALFWYQKARNNCLKFRGHNLRFFHASTMVKRKCKRIETLRNLEGQ